MTNSCRQSSAHRDNFLWYQGRDKFSETAAAVFFVMRFAPASLAPAPASLAPASLAPATTTSALATAVPAASASLALAPTNKKKATIRINHPKIKINN